MIAVILADEHAGKKRENNLGPGQPYESHHFFKRRSMSPGRQRLRDVLTCGIFAAKKPHIHNSKRRAGSARFNLTNISQSCGVLRSRLVRAASSTRAVNYRDALAFIDGSREIWCNGGFVVRMGNHDQNVGFVTLV